MRISFFILLALISLTSGIATAQSFKMLNARNDTNYVEDHSQDLLIRVFSSKKSTQYAIGQDGLSEKLKYNSNDNINFGVGFNYRYIGLNIAARLPFINNDQNVYGRTRFLDLQTYYYFRRLLFDIYAQWYNGYYLSDKGILKEWNGAGKYPLRGDMKTRNFGVNAQYVFNSASFSLRAPFGQTDYQKKSAGSFIVGGGVHYITARADSSIIPSDIIYADFFGNYRYNKSNTLSFGVNGGYAYTLVIAKHFFLMGALTVGAGGNYTGLKSNLTTDTKEGFNLGFNGNIRLAAGYNSPRLFVGVQYLEFLTRNNAPVPQAWQRFETASMRLTVARRFSTKNSFTRRLDKVDNMLPRNLRPMLVSTAKDSTYAPVVPTKQ